MKLIIYSSWTPLGTAIEYTTELGTVAWMPNSLVIQSLSRLEYAKCYVLNPSTLL